MQQVYVRLLNLSDKFPVIKMTFELVNKLLGFNFLLNFNSIIVILPLKLNFLLF